MGYIKLTDGSSYSDSSYTLRCFSYDTIPTLINLKDVEYHGTASYNIIPNSIDYVYSKAKENWSGVPGIIQTTVSGSAFPGYPPDVQESSFTAYMGDTLDLLTQTGIVRQSGAATPVSLNADGLFNPGINYLVESGTAAGTVTLESTYLDNIHSGFMDTDLQDFYIEMPVWGWPGTAVAGTANSVTFSSSPIYNSSETVTIPLTSVAMVNSFSGSGDINLKINRSVLVDGSISAGSVDLENINRIKITLQPSLGSASYSFKTGQMKVVPNTYSHYQTNVDTKQGILRMEKWGSGIVQTEMPAILQNGLTVKNFKSIAKFIVDTNHFDSLISGLYYSDERDVAGSSLPEASSPHQLSVFSRVHPNRSTYSNLYLETRLTIDNEKVKIAFYEGNALISETVKTGQIPAGNYYLIVTYKDNKQNAQLYHGQENFIDSLYLETGERPISNAWLNGTGNKSSYGGYDAGFGYSGYQFKPQYGNFYLDYIYTQDVALSEYESKSFESNLPVIGATLYANGSSDTELFLLGQNGFEKVVSSDNFKKGQNQVGSLDTDVIVSDDTIVIAPNEGASSIRVTKNSNSYISSLQYSEVLRVPNFSRLTFKAKLRYDGALEGGKFKITFWDSARSRIAFIQTIENITPNQWNDLEIPLISDSLYNNRLVFEIGHIGNISQSGSFWLQSPSLTTESVEWSISNNDGLQYLPVLNTNPDQYTSINFLNNYYYSTLTKNSPNLFYSFDDPNDTNHIFGSTTALNITNRYPKNINNGTVSPITGATASPSYVYPVTAPNTFNTFVSGETYEIPRCVKSEAKSYFIGLYGSGTIQASSVSGFSNTDLTYSIAFYTDKDQYNYRLGQHGGTASPDWKMSLVGTASVGQPTLRFVSGSGTVDNIIPSTNGTATWADNNWHYAAFTYDDSYLKIYYDGDLISVTPSSTFSMPIFTGPFQVLGPEYSATSPQIATFINGVYKIDTSVPITWIHSIVAYNKALTNDQINEQYLAAISEYNKLKVRAKALTKDAWISGYELIPKYANLGRLLDKSSAISNQVIFDQSAFDFAKFSDI